MALPSGSIHKLQHCEWCSTQRHRHVVHKWPHLHGLEGIWLFIVGSRKTYVVSTTTPLVLLTDLLVHSGVRKECAQVRHPLNPFKQGKLIRRCQPALQSSKTSIAFTPLGRLIWPTSFSISRTAGNKISGPYSLRSSSSSAINLHPSTTSSLSSTLLTKMARSNQALLHSYSASETCSECKKKPRFILSSMRSMNVLTLLGCLPRAKWFLSL